MDDLVTKPVEDTKAQKPASMSHEQIVEEVSVAPFEGADTQRPDLTGKDSQAVDIGNINGFIEVVSSVPSSKPKNFYQQIKIYVNGTTRRLYVYNYKANAWRYTALT